MAKVFCYWLPMPLIGTLNGIFHGLVLMLFLSEFHARQLSSLILMGLITVYVAIIYPRLQLQTAKDAWRCGIIWLLLTVTFEFLLGYFVSNLPLDAMLAEYNLAAGNLWSAVLILILVLPYGMYRFQRKNKT